jgi:hypothetical protein
MNDAADNPYRAPQAQLIDVPLPGEERGPRPGQVAIAVGLLWLTLLIQAGALTFLWRLFRLFPPYMFVVAGTITVIWALTAFLVAMIERGHNWARITYLVAFLIGLPFSALSILANLGQAPVVGIAAVVAQIVLQIAAMVLLFSGASGAWFRGETPP